MANPLRRAAKDISRRTASGGRKQQITPGALLSPFERDKPQFHEWDEKKAIDDGFKASVWVYSAITRIMQAVASVPWVVGIEDESGEIEIVNNHPLKGLIDEPNPFMSWNDLVKRFVSHLYLAGNGLLSKIFIENGNENVLAELWPLSPIGVKPVPSKTDFIKEYELNNDGSKKTIPSEKVVHAMFTDPGNPYWGMAPLQAAARIVDTDVEAVRWNKVSLQNRAIADGAFTFDQPLTREQWEEARDRLRELHQGPDNARAPWVLGNGARWNPMSLTPAEMDFVESRGLTREEILSVFGVPPPLVGIYQQATLTNIETSRRIFWLDTIIPLLKDIRSVLQRSVARHFQDKESGKVIVDFDLTNVDAVREAFAEKVDAAKDLWEMGFPTSVIVKLLGIDVDTEWPGFDTSYVPARVIPAGMATGEEDSLDGVL